MSRFTRRRFLEDSMFATAAAIAAASRPRGAHAQGAAKKAAPSDRLRVAVIGVNGRGMSHVRAFSDRPDTEVAVICDVDDTTFERPRKLVEGKTGKAPAFQQDLRRVLEDKSIDIITVATPNHWHSLSAIWAVQAGKDVYLEKPVEPQRPRGAHGGAVRPQARAHRADRLAEPQQPGHAAVHRLRPLGQARQGHAWRAASATSAARASARWPAAGKPPSTVDYDLWLGPAAARKDVPREQFHYDWHWQWDYGNGDIGNQGVHEMDKARWGLGKTTLPTSVVGLGGRFGYDDDGETPNTPDLLLRLRRRAAGVRGARACKTDDFKGAKVGNIFHGTEGYAVSNSYSSGTIFDLKGEKVTSFSGDADHFDNFVKAVRSRKHTDLTADIQEGHLSAALCHLGNISYRLGKYPPLGKKPTELAKIRESEEAFGRFEKHLADNGVPLDKTPFKLGRRADGRPQDGDLHQRPTRGQRPAARRARKGFLLVPRRPRPAC